MILTNQKPDNLGALASGLCLIHCIATPFVFIVQSCSLTCCEKAPSWWSSIDYLFVIISFFAIYRSTKTTTRYWIKPALWFTWTLLLFVILNEKYAWLNLHENAIYFPALLLIGLHLFNRKYCQCDTTKCCSNEK